MKSFIQPSGTKKTAASATTSTTDVFEADDLPRTRVAVVVLEVFTLLF
jgi:hypothetical protein